MVNGKRYFPNSYYLVGIGGSGMMPLAMILAGRGAHVEGSDRSLDAGRVSAKFDALRALGVVLHPQDGSGVVAGEQIVVASAAVEETVADMVAARRVGATVLRRPDLLAQLFNASALPIGIAGTSGKSTVTGMVGFMLNACGRDPTVMNGAVMANFAAPDAPFASALVGHGDAFVSEVDESDGSIALYRPRIALLNNVSRDHKEMDELRALFGGFLARADAAIVNIDNAEAASLAPAGAVTVAIDRPADLQATEIDEARYGVSFTLIAEGTRYPVQLVSTPGRHNVANALMALAAVRAAGVPLAQAIGAIGRFGGITRRFELIGEANGIGVIDDFGHNPDKIAATLATLRAFAGRLLILFQPHGYGPLRKMATELAAAFAAGLATEDLLIVCDPVDQGGTVDRTIGSAAITAPLAALGRDARHIADRDDAAQLLVETARPGDRIVVMGARDDTLGQLARRVLAGVAARATS